MGQSSINSFSKGMLNDQGQLVPVEGSYIDAENIRIVANEDNEESAVLVNVQGNTHSFDLNYPCGTCRTIVESSGNQTFSVGSPIQVLPGQAFVYLGETYVSFFSTLVIFSTVGQINSALSNFDIKLCNSEVIYELNLAGLLPQCSALPIGYASIRDTVYVYGVNNTTSNPGGVFNNMPSSASSEGFIFKINFDLKTNAANTPVLIYTHPELNFSAQYPIEAIGRYESSEVQRLYWTDNYNPVRTINVANPSVADLIPEELDINPSTTFSKPEILEVISGGSLPAGMYQYAYRLRSKSGSETRFSPFTGFLHIVEASESGTAYWTYTEDPEDISQYEGSDPGAISSKAVKLEVNNIDLAYDTIEFAAIYKSTVEGVSSSYIFESRVISSGVEEVLHSSNTDIISLISLTEITSFNYNIKRAKTLEVKDNRLFLGNVITPIEELQFNARAYRYRREDLKQYAITPAENVSTYVSDIDFDPNNYNPLDYQAEDLDLLLDAINPYNENLLAVNYAEKRYVYQENGVTLGGEGPNVSYRFIKKQLNGDTYVAGDTAVSPPFISTNSDTEVDCGVGVDWLDYKNPLAVEKYKGYQRDEIYRFGIVLYDMQGNPGFVNWVGDIRFPRFKDFDVDKEGDLANYTLSQTRSKSSVDSGELYSNTGSQSGVSFENMTDLDGEDLSQYTGSTDGLVAGYGKDLTIDTHVLYALGIEFNVTIPDEIKNKISGYSIVRVKRKEIDKSVVAIGMGAYMYQFAEDVHGDDDETFMLAHSAYMATWAHNNGEYASAKDFGRIWSNKMTMDSPDFTFTGKYPTAGSCDWIQVVGNLTNGASRNAWENHFLYGGQNTGTDDDYYRKMYSHQTLMLDSHTSDNPYIFMASNGQASSEADGSFFKPANARKFEAGGSLSDAFFPRGINNIGVEVNNGTSQDVYSIGCDTLFVEFEAGVENTNGFSTMQDELLPSTASNPTSAQFPYWSYWTNPAKDNITHNQEPNPNQIYFNNGDSGDSNIEQSYFAGSDPLDVCVCGEESGSDRYDAPFKRHKVQEKPLLAWRRDIFDLQYGGNKREDRTRNVYINANNFTPVNATTGTLNTTVEVYGGDTFVQFYDFQKLRRWRSESQSPDSGYTNNTSGPAVKHSFSYGIPIESTINTGLRQGYHWAGKDTETGFTGKETDGKQLDQYIYGNVYSAENDLLIFSARPLDYKETDQHDSRVIYSELKINGDLKDSWRQFKLNNYRDLDAEYGQINKIVRFSDNIFYFQDRGVGMLSINPVAITTAANQSDIVLGTGEVIQDSKYFSTNVGSKHQRSVLSTNKGLYWIDILNNAAYKITNQGALELSRVKGLKNYFEKRLEKSNFPLNTYNNFIGSGLNLGDNAFHRNGITLGYDSRNNEVLYSFIERRENVSSGKPYWYLYIAETLVYSETTGTFTSKYTFGSPMFIDTQDKLLSVRPWTTNPSTTEALNKNQIWRHNSTSLTNPIQGSWYGDVYDCSVSFISNTAPTQTKVFDNLELYTEITGVENLNTTWDKLNCDNSYQSSVLNLVPEQTIIRRERTWKTVVPRNKTNTQRLRDKYLKIKLSYDNTKGGKLKTHYVKTKFRVSKR